MFFFASRYRRDRSVGSDLEGNALDDLEAVAADRHVLGRVVRHQAHLADAEVAQDLAADAVVADVRREAELLVRRDGVVPLVLQLVRLELVDEPDAAALLEQVEEDAPARLDDLLHGERELGAAVAAGRTEDVAGQALRVDADEDRLVFADLPVNERDVLLVGDVALYAVRRELSEPRREVRRCDPVHEPLVSSCGGGSGPRRSP